MKATLISVVEELVEELYRQITLTPEQVEQAQRARNVNDRNDLIYQPAPMAQVDAQAKLANREKIFDAYYLGAISLRTLQDELERLVSTMDHAQDNSLSHTVAPDPLLLRENALQNYRISSCKQRKALHGAVFTTLTLERDSLNNPRLVSLRPFADFAREVREAA